MSDIELSLASARVLIFPCFLDFESNTFCVLRMRAEKRPKTSLAEANSIHTGIPTPVVRVTTDAIFRAVIAVITEESLMVDLVFYNSCPADPSVQLCFVNLLETVGLLFVRRWC